MSRKKTAGKRKSPKPAPAKRGAKPARPAKVRAGHPPRAKAATSGRKRVRPSPAAPTPPPPPPPGASPKDRAIASLTFARGMTRDLIKAFREDQSVFQATPTDNHLLWTLGHLAQSFDWFSGLIDGKPSQIPATYQQLFGFKSLPHANATNYPPLQEILEQFNRTYQRFMDAAASLSEIDVLSACAADSFGYAKDRLEVIERAAWHEGWHAGQLSSLRRALNLPPIMG